MSIGLFVAGAAGFLLGCLAMAAGYAMTADEWGDEEDWAEEDIPC